uniref:Transmembrane protein n=1 Tax=Corethron hystrix TaxID=216773 RepID=A0A6U5IPN5_9STRA|mmetsp:Transcript_34570/g.79925  ORF Transcript_34570/g.79925 Transcript_34570/m.79925 type:complete len:179 (+) Transcript_34570:89-625(+)
MKSSFFVILIHLGKTSSFLSCSPLGEMSMLMSSNNRNCLKNAAFISSPTSSRKACTRKSLTSLLGKFSSQPRTVCHLIDTDDEEFQPGEDKNSTPSVPTPKKSLEEKMLEWEATDEELRAASLGGMMPRPAKSQATDGFDIGLWIMFPFIVVTSLLFFVFPFIMDKIDVSSVGPPPMV